jgi:hypothetical protein
VAERYCQHQQLLLAICSLPRTLRSSWCAGLGRSNQAVAAVDNGADRKQSDCQTRKELGWLLVWELPVAVDMALLCPVTIMAAAAGDVRRQMARALAKQRRLGAWIEPGAEQR